MTIISSTLKPYFNYNPADKKASNFAQHLMADMGKFKAEDSNLIVNIGGDGTILWSLHHLPNIPNFALKPPGSSSALHNGHHNINNAADLNAAFYGATAFSVPTLRGEVGLSNGDVITINAFQDIHIRSFNSQAVLPQVSVNGKLLERDMNCGVIVSLPLGSTGINETRGGMTLPPEKSGVVLTLDGITNPSIRKHLKAAGRLSRTLDTDAVIDIAVSPTGEKRVSSIVFDNFTMMPDGQIFDQSGPITIDTTLQHIQTLRVYIDTEEPKTLLHNSEFRTPR